MKRRITALMDGSKCGMSLVACGGSNIIPQKIIIPQRADPRQRRDTSDLKIGLVTDVGGVNDGSFQPDCMEGMERELKRLE